MNRAEIMLREMDKNEISYTSTHLPNLKKLRDIKDEIN